METPLNPYDESSGRANGPTRQPLIMTSEEMTIAVLILCAGVVIVSCLCIMAKLDWAKLSGRRKRKKSILIKKAAKKLEAEGRLKNADQAARKATAKKPEKPAKKVVTVPNGTEPPKKVIKTESGQPVIWHSRFEEDGVTEKEKEKKGAGDVKPVKKGDQPPAKKVIKDESGREVPWKPTMQDNKPLMIFELSENRNAVPLEKFPWDTTPAVANPTIKARIVNNVPVKGKSFSKGDKNLANGMEHTIVTSEKEFGPSQLSSKLMKKIVRADSVDSVDEFFEARKPSDVSLDMSLVMDDTTHQPVFVFDSIPNTLRLS